MKKNKIYLKRYFFCVFALSLLLCSNIAFGATIRVPADQSTIQAGIDVASDGDTVLVADGTYTGVGNKDINFKGKAITVQSENGPENCIVDCEGCGGIGLCFWVQGFLFYNGEREDTVLSGFTIINGYGGGGGIYCANSSPTITNCIISDNMTPSPDMMTEWYGGGIYCANSSSPTITNCTISGNTSQCSGGGIYCGYYSSPTITNCIISGNIASHDAGGIWCSYGSSATITNCTINGNTAQWGGGGIYCTSKFGSLTIANCTISGNTAYRNGGGIYCDNFGAIITNCTINGNIAHQDGGGIACVGYDSSLTIANCTISGNTAYQDGGGIGCPGPGGFPTITNCILWGDGATRGPEIALKSTYYPPSLAVSYCDVEGGEAAVHMESGCTLNWGDGNIDAAPLFVGDGDYHLTASSPCVDAGTAFEAPDYDIDGDSRPQGNGYDMGSDELSVEGVKLGNIYIDDSGDKDILVNKAKGDSIEIVHVISNTETVAKNLTLQTTVPDNWTFKYWYMRDDSKGTNYSGHQDQHQYLGSGKHEIQVGNISGSKTVQIGLRFQISENALPQTVAILSEISLETGIPLISDLTTKACIVSSTRAIIVTNRANFYEIYGDAQKETTELLKTLFSIADGNEKGEVSSVVYYADWYDQDIKDWNNQDPNLYDGTPNDVADKLDSLLEGWAQNLFIASPKYILIVGGDDILPFYRIKDPTWDIPFFPQTEANYTDLIVTKNDYYFSDTKYADLKNDDYMKGELEAEIGRIVGANVKDMKKLMLKGLEGPKGDENIVLASHGWPCIDTDGALSIFINNGFGVSVDTIRNNNWTRETFKNCVNQGVKFVVDFTHANHTLFCCGNNEWPRLTVEYIQTNIDKLNDDSGYFVGIGGCHGGAIEDNERGAPDSSSLAYKFINKGACGYFGSSGYTKQCSLCDDKAFGEVLFDSFFSRLNNYRSVGTAYRLACINYDEGWIWTSWDKKTVTEFNIFGIPWMEPNFPESGNCGSLNTSSYNGKTLDFWESKPKRIETERVKGSPLSPEIFGKNVTFTVADYSISQHESFDLINIAGAQLQHKHFEPVLPMLKMTLNLPKDSSITSVQLIEGHTQSLGQLNIPNSQPSTTTDPLPPFTEDTEITGLYPLTNYGYDVDHYNDHVEVKIYFVPVQHDVDTKETTLWDEATLEVQYEIEGSIFVSVFSTSKSKYNTAEDISATSVIENASSEAVSGLTAVLTLKDLQGQTIDSTQDSLLTVPAGGSIETTINIANGLNTGSYLLKLEIKDETTSTLAKSSRYIKVTSESISAFLVPEKSPNTDVDIPFVVTFENYNPYQITADVQIKIYKDNGEKVSTLMAPSQNIAAQSSADIITNWNCLNKDVGLYGATATVTVNSKRYSANSQFMIVCAGDFDGDGDVDGSDLAVFAADFGRTNCGAEDPCEGDFDKDGDVDGSDLAVFAADFGRTDCPR